MTQPRLIQTEKRQALSLLAEADIRRCVGITERGAEAHPASIDLERDAFGIVDCYKGEIGVDTELGRGTTMQLRMSAQPLRTPGAPRPLEDGTANRPIAVARPQWCEVNDVLQASP
jgi:hypothetical protein